MVLLAATQATTAITSTPDMINEVGFRIYGAEGLNTSTGSALEQDECDKEIDRPFDIQQKAWRE